MASAEDLQAYKECGYCLQPQKDILVPKLLRCGHVHCLACLDGAYLQEVICCPHCGVTCIQRPETLAEIDIATGAVKEYCGMCTTPQRATNYCLDCHQKLCNNHIKTHDLHTILAISEYTTKDEKTRAGYCREHGRQLVVVGCKACGKHLCSSCLDDSQKCTFGGSHVVDSLESVIAAKNYAVERTLRKVQWRKENLQRISKETSRTLTQFDEDTQEMLNSLNATKDKQIHALSEKYDPLRHELMESREAAKSQLTAFRDDIVQVQYEHLTDLSRQLQASIADQHQVDTKEKVDVTKEHIYALLAENLPSLSIPKVLQLSQENNNIPVEISTAIHLTQAEEIIIAPEGTDVPTTLTLFKEMKVSDSCFCVSTHQNVVYVGQSNSKGIDRIINQNHLLPSFLQLGGPVWSTSADENGNLYSLVSKGSSWVVQVSRRTGEAVTSWKLAQNVNNKSALPDPSSERGTTGLTYVGNHIVIPDVTNQTISVYTKTGEMRSSIRCYLGSPDTAICTLDDRSVIISARETSKIFRMNVETGEIAWTYSFLKEPGGVVCYGDQYVLISPAYTTETSITVLDATNGKFVKKLTDPMKRKPSWIYNICIEDNTLIIPRCNEKVVLFYDLY